jgi:hypothetical protein
VNTIKNKNNDVSMNKYSILLSDEEVHKLQTINSKDIPFNLFLEQIIREKINYIPLENGFSYNFSNKSLFDEKGVKVNFTKIEETLFDYIISLSLDNKDKFADIESITSSFLQTFNVIDSIRNKVKSIREKTFYELIKNKNSIGYRVNLNSLQINKN